MPKGARSFQGCCARFMIAKMQLPYTSNCKRGRLGVVRSVMLKPGFDGTESWTDCMVSVNLRLRNLLSNLMAVITAKVSHSQE